MNTFSRCKYTTNAHPHKHLQIFNDNFNIPFKALPPRKMLNISTMTSRSKPSHGIFDYEKNAFVGQFNKKY